MLVHTPNRRIATKGGTMTTLHRRRNPVAQAAILRKGGVHEKSRKAKRQKQKRELRNSVSKAMATYRGHSFIWAF